MRGTVKAVVVCTKGFAFTVEIGAETFCIRSAGVDILFFPDRTERGPARAAALNAVSEFIHDHRAMLAGQAAPSALRPAA
jgi:hypothetical protein